MDPNPSVVEDDGKPRELCRYCRLLVTADAVNLTLIRYQMYLSIKISYQLILSFLVFLGSTVDYKLGRTVFAKTQIAQPEHIVTFEGGALLVIRNPRRMIAAEYIRRKKEAEPGRTFTQEELASWFQQPGNHSNLNAICWQVVEHMSYH